MECAGCTNPLHEAARFCERCGTAVSGRMAVTPMTHSPDTWTYGGTAPDGPTSPYGADTAAWRYDDTPTWHTPPPPADPWADPARTPAGETSTWQARPAFDAPVDWDDTPASRGSRTAVTIGAVTLVALVGLGGAGAWAVTRGGDTPVVPPAPTSVTPLPPVAPTTVPPTTTPSTTGDGNGYGSGDGSGDGSGGAPGIVPSVVIDPSVAGDPDAAAVADLLQRYFAAINASDFAAWKETVTSRRSRDETESAWLAGYSTTLDRDVRLVSLSAGGDSGTRIATVTFTSTQDPSKAPDGVSTQLCWTASMPIAGSGSDVLVGAGGRATSGTC